MLDSELVTVILYRVRKPGNSEKDSDPTESLLIMAPDTSSQHNTTFPDIKARYVDAS